MASGVTSLRANLARTLLRCSLQRGSLPLASLLRVFTLRLPCSFLRLFSAFPPHPVSGVKIALSTQNLGCIKAAKGCLLDAISMRIVLEAGHGQLSFSPHKLARTSQSHCPRFQRSSLTDGLSCIFVMLVLINTLRVQIIDFAGTGLQRATRAKRIMGSM